MTMPNHAERIPDQHQLDAAILDQAGKAVVIGGQAGELLTLLLHLFQVRNRNLVV
jgi:hypothetical protein